MIKSEEAETDREIPSGPGIGSKLRPESSLPERRPRCKETGWVA